jgi:hypothetical protein
MPVQVRALGETVSLMRIGRRQLRLRGPRKRDKPLIVIKTKSVPSETPYSLDARIQLAEAAIAMRGKTLEEVVTNVIKECAGKTYKPETVKRAEKEAQYIKANANLERMRKKRAELERIPIEEYLAMRGLAAFPERF